MGNTVTETDKTMVSDLADGQSLCDGCIKLGIKGNLAGCINDSRGSSSPVKELDVLGRKHLWAMSQDVGNMTRQGACAHGSVGDCQ